MGIIQRQALRNTLINFAGNILGGLTRVVMPVLNISPAQIGLMTLLDFISGIFVTIFTLGFDQVMIKLFPRFRDDDRGHYGFFAFGIFLSLFGIGISFILFYLFGEYFLKEDHDVDLYQRFSFLIFPMIFFRIIFVNIDSYTRMLFNTVIGVFLENFLSKVVIAFALIAFALKWADFDWLIYLYSIAFCLPGFGVLLYAFINTKKIVFPQREVFTKGHRKEIYNYAVFGLLMGASSSIIIYVDSLMIGGMISLKAVGFYSIFFMAARFILIPGRSINRIATVVIAEAWEKNDLKTIREIYQKSSVNLMLIASYLLGIGLISIAPVMSLSEGFDPYLPYVNLFLILGVGFLIEMATGVNMAIIATSSHYQYNTYFNILMALMVIGLNLILIPSYNLFGCALASMISMSLVNFMRWFLLFRKYNLQPFGRSFLKPFLLGLVFLIVCNYVDYSMPAIPKLILNFILLSIIFWTIVVRFKLSEDVNKWLLKMRLKFFKN